MLCGEPLVLRGTACSLRQGLAACVHQLRQDCNSHPCVPRVSASARVSPLVVSDSLRPSGLWLSRLLCPWDSPGKNTGVGSHPLLQGISPTRESNPGLLHCRQILYHLSHQGSPCVNYTSNIFLKKEKIITPDLELYMKKGGDILSF